MAPRHEDGRPVDLTSTEARQASPRRDNYRVLVLSTILCALAFVLIYLAFTERAQLIPSQSTETREGR